MITFILSLGLSFSIGTTFISPPQAWHIFTTDSSLLSEKERILHTILYSIRIPRSLVAALCGALLAAAGTLSQGLFRNPLAAPSILGTTSGGVLGAVTLFYFNVSFQSWYATPLAAFVGALSITAVILFLSARKPTWSLQSILLVGFTLNAFLGAFTSLLISLTLQDVQKTAVIMHWMLGGFSAKGWEHLTPIIIPSLIAFYFSKKIISQLDLLAMGEGVASTLSINVHKLKTITIVLISMLVGLSVSVAGAVPFVGLIVPHISRKMIGPNNRSLLYLSIINGMSLTLIADILARTLRAPLEIEVGVLTSLIGAPFFLYILMKEKV